jgi:hypothetical protein
MPRQVTETARSGANDVRVEFYVADDGTPRTRVFLSVDRTDGTRISESVDRALSDSALTGAQKTALRNSLTTIRDEAKTAAGL